MVLDCLKLILSGKLIRGMTSGCNLSKLDCKRTAKLITLRLSFAVTPRKENGIK